LSMGGVRQEPSPEQVSENPGILGGEGAQGEAVAVLLEMVNLSPSQL
jgi:hypothetical protein